MGNAIFQLSCILPCRSLGFVLLLKLAIMRSSQPDKTEVFLPIDASVSSRNHDGIDQITRMKLWNYVDSIFPPVYDVNRSVWSSMYDELIRYHPYITIFNWTDSCSQKEKLTTSIYLLTVQSMLMFLMAVFIDLEVCLIKVIREGNAVTFSGVVCVRVSQSPEDTGECNTYKDEDSCLTRKSMFDSNENMCAWTDPADLPANTDDGQQHYPCTFVEPYLSWKVD